MQRSPAAAEAPWLRPEEFGRLGQELLFDSIEEISLTSRHGSRTPSARSGSGAVPDQSSRP